MTPAVYYRVNLYCRGESDKERNKHCCQHCWWNDPCCTASAVSCLCDLWAKNHWSKLHMFLELPQLGTRHSCCVNLTQFQGQTIVFCHITTKYCVKTPFWLRVANCFRSIAYTGYRCLSWIRCCMVAFQKCRNVNRTPSSVNYCTICRWNIWILRRFVMLFLLVGLCGNGNYKSC